MIRDVRYYEAIDRLEKLHTSDEVFCHRKYGVTCSDSMAPSTSNYSSRRSVKPVDCNLFISCQTFNKDKLFNISTLSVSNRILQDSKLENTMSLRLAGVNDLIAAEGKYHNKCLNAYTENEKGM